MQGIRLFNCVENNLNWVDFAGEAVIYSGHQNATHISNVVKWERTFWDFEMLRLVLIIPALLCALVVRADIASDAASWTNGVYYAGAGDSRVEGVPSHQTQIDGGESGNLAFDPIYRLRANSGVGFPYTNFGYGGKRLVDVNVTEMPWVLAAHPKRLTIQCGVNDINKGWVWSDELTNLIAIKAKCDSTNIMLVLEEIFPWSNGNDAQALTIRTWNTNLANYAASNGVTLVKIHDALGQLRVSTGFLDDIKTSYNQDGVHLNASGQDAWSLLLLTNLVGAVSGNNSTLNTANRRSAP